MTDSDEGRVAQSLSSGMDRLRQLSQQKTTMALQLLSTQREDDARTSMAELHEELKHVQSEASLLRAEQGETVRHLRALQVGCGTCCQCELAQPPL